MSDWVHVVIKINTDHWVRDVDKVFSAKEDAEQYCEDEVEKHYQDIRDSEHTEQKGDYIWTNGVDDWGLVIEQARFVEGDCDE